MIYKIKEKLILRSFKYILIVSGHVQDGGQQNGNIFQAMKSRVKKKPLFFNFFKSPYHFYCPPPWKGLNTF